MCTLTLCTPLPPTRPDRCAGARRGRGDSPRTDCAPDGCGGDLSPTGDSRIETGYGQCPDGMVWAATLTTMPEVTAAMWDWWFGWHSNESARYKRWHPDAHRSAALRHDLTKSSIPDREKYVGNISYVDEHIGPKLQQLAIARLDDALRAGDASPGRLPTAATRPVRAPAAHSNAGPAVRCNGWSFPIFGARRVARHGELRGRFCDHGHMTTRPGIPLAELLQRALAHPRSATASSNAADDQILDAAVSVIASKGAHAATIDDVAAAAGVGRSTIYRKFANKDDLFERALRRVVGQLLDELAHRFAYVTDPTDQVVEGFALWLRLNEHPLLASGDPVRRAEIIDGLTRGDNSAIKLAHKAIRSNIATAQAAGELPPGDPDRQADVLVHLALGYLCAPSVVDDLTDPDAVARLARTAIAPVLTGRLSLEAP